MADVQNITDFIANSRKRLDLILKNIGWTLEETKNIKRSVSKDSPKTSLQNDDEDFYPEPAEWKHSVKLDEPKIFEVLKSSPFPLRNQADAIIPEKISDSFVNYSKEQRLALYEHVIQKTGHLSEPDPAGKLRPDQQKSFAEIFARKKTEKRKSAKQRVEKRPPLSRSEELRQLISLQMEAFFDFKSQSSGKPQDEGLNKSGKDSRKFESASKLEIKKNRSKSPAHRSRRSKEDKHRKKHRKGSRSRSRKRDRSGDHNKTKRKKDRLHGKHRRRSRSSS